MNILKRKDFRNLMIGKAMSAIGSNVQQFALSLYVLATTGSATIFASMLAISILPRILLSPIAGVFGDWFDRKKTIVRLDLLNAFLIGLYALYFYINGSLSLWSIYLIVIILEIVEIFFGSAMGAVIPSMIEKEKLMEANSVRSLIMSIANILAPVIASSLYGLIGLMSVLVLNAISFLFSALLEMSIHVPAFHKQPEKINIKQFRDDFIDGLSVLKEQRILLNIIALGVFLNFSLSPLFSIGLIFIIMDLLGATEIQFGFIMTLAGSAMLLGPLLLAKKAQSIPVGRLLILTFLAVGFLIMLMAYASTPSFIALFGSNLVPLSLITGITFIVAMLTTLSNIALGTLFDTLVPREYHGRVGSVMNMGLMATIPLGQILFGFAIDRFSAPLTVACVGAITLGAILYFRKPFTQQEEPSCTTLSTSMKAE
jgi:MFS family permease